MERTQTERRLRGYKEGASYLGVHADTLRRGTKKGLIRTVQIGRRVLIPQEELERIAQQGLGK